MGSTSWGYDALIDWHEELQSVDSGGLSGRSLLKGVCARASPEGDLTEQSGTTRRRVIVTGATKGIGLAVARVFVNAGDEVIGLYGHDARAAHVARGLLGPRCSLRRCDVSHPTQLRRTIESIWEDRPCHVLVNNAAVVVRVPALEMSLDDWSRVLDTNLTAYFVASQVFAQLSVRSGVRGSIIQVSSIDQDKASPNRISYLAAKGGVRMLTKAFALELAPYGIRVNAVAPGTIETELNRELLRDPGFRAERLAAHPIGRLGRPDDVAQSVYFLASEAASFITGATLTVDGGLSVR